jgi:ABC-type phosphate/phosphonate transport system permease subunit
MNSTSDSSVGESVRDVPGWRAFVPILFIGMAVIGMAHPKNADMAAGYAACGGGALVAAVYAIFIRNLKDFWSIIWRLYLAYIGASFVFGGFGAGGAGAASALGASIAAGIFVIPSGVAVFFWDNIATKIISYVLVVFLAISLFKAFA